MTLFAVVVVLTALAALEIVLTRLRLRGAGGAGRTRVPARLVDAHTAIGLLALVVWTTFLAAPEDSAPGAPVVGLLGLALWWVEVGLGLLLLLRWLPSRGRHSGESQTDGWSRGPWLSLLAHVGLFAGTIVFSIAYAGSSV